MFNRLKPIVASILSSLLLASCGTLRDDYGDCGVWLEFIFDYNMEATDSFSESVEKVDVLVFDESGKLYTSLHSTTAALAHRKRMFLGGADMPRGRYTIVTVGGLTDHFAFSRPDGGAFTPGVTTLDQVRFALRHGAEVAHEFPHVWFGPSTGIDYRADLSVWPVSLVRQTNKFNIALERNVAGQPTRAGAANNIYTFEITAPESGDYGHTNRPLVSDRLVHRPWSLSREANLTTGKLNTMRLLENHEEGYTISVRNSLTGETLWSHDLIELLGMTGERRLPDGTSISLQEYLDRQSDWNIVIVHNTADPPVGGEPATGFVALQIRVNGWIVWQTGVGI